MGDSINKLLLDKSNKRLKELILLARKYRKLSLQYKKVKGAYEALSEYTFALEDQALKVLEHSAKLETEIENCKPFSLKHLNQCSWLQNKKGGNKVFMMNLLTCREDYQNLLGLFGSLTSEDIRGLSLLSIINQIGANIPEEEYQE